MQKTQAIFLSRAQHLHRNRIVADKRFTPYI
jgi:hypothetical protein